MLFARKVRRYLLNLYLPSGGLFFSLILIALFVWRFYQAQEKRAPAGFGSYVLQVADLEKKSSPQGGSYQQIDFRSLDPEPVLLRSLSSDSSLQKLQLGQTIFAQGDWQALPDHHSLQPFDYGAYLFRKGIHGRLQIQRWHLLDSTAQIPWWVAQRQALLQTIEQWPWTLEQKALFKALLLGYRSDLGAEQKEAFAAAGALHLLAVSGLHVGVIYLLLQGLLRLLPHFRYRRLLQFLTLNGLLWLYALLCGAGPSVLRAVSMFSFLSLGRLSRRPLASLRSLVYSALLWLWIDPQLIFSVGFQLSYLALLGILIFMPRLQDLYLPKNPWLAKLVQVNYLSISAQAFTLPLSLYYFQQFPLYFMLSSFLLLPLISLIMYCGLLLLLTAELPLVGDFILEYYPYLLEALQSGVQLIQSFPYAVIPTLKLRPTQIAVYFLVIIALLAIVQPESKQRLAWDPIRIGLVSASLALVLSLLPLFSRRQSPVLMLHPKQPRVVEIASGDRSFYLHDLDSVQWQRYRKWWKLAPGSRQSSWRENRVEPHFQVHEGRLELRDEEMDLREFFSTKKAP